MPTPKQRAAKRASPPSKPSKSRTPTTKSAATPARPAKPATRRIRKSTTKAFGTTKTAAAKAARKFAKSTKGNAAKAAAKARTSKAAGAKPAGKTAGKAGGKRSKPVTRADFGAPIAGFFAKQPAALRPLLEELRDLVQDAAPDAKSSIKWGMPFFMLDGGVMCAIGGHKGHVNLILSGPPGTYADPENLLRGDGKTGRHLKLVAGDRVPRDAVRGWLASAVEQARRKG